MFFSSIVVGCQKTEILVQLFIQIFEFLFKTKQHFNMSITIPDANTFIDNLAATLVASFDLADHEEAIKKMITAGLSKSGLEKEDEESLMSEGEGDEVASSEEAPKAKAPVKAKGKPKTKAPVKAKASKAKKDSSESESSSEETPKKKKAPVKAKAPAKGTKASKAPAKKTVAKGKATKAPVEEDDSNFEGMTVAQLKALLKEKKIKFDAKMKKAELVALMEDVSGGESSGDESSGEKEAEKDEIESLTLAELKERIDSLNEGKEKADKISKVGKKTDLIERIKAAGGEEADEE
jgi:hypothetical protein